MIAARGLKPLGQVPQHLELAEPEPMVNRATIAELNDQAESI
ncbi:MULTISPECIES: hypothetical protein [Nocardia]|uniref:Uncharacterized protein n=1 Tax=Nocardia carnea TaxID=37328 RepID=A0ABW7TNR3_9NOCA|nr:MULTISPECIES: hypothetical protein [Nocardia]